MKTTQFKIVSLTLFALTLAACDNDNSARTNVAPTISAVADVSIQANEQSGQIFFQVNDEFTDPGLLEVTASSDNTTLINAQSFSFNVAGGNRSVQITPISELLGSSNITLTVSDADGLTSSTSFTVTVNQQMLDVGQFAVQLFNDSPNDSPRTFDSRQFVGGDEGANIYPTVAQ